MWDQAKSLLKKLSGQKPDEQPSSAVAGPVCCQADSLVHIAYRGVSDDRLYMAYNRKWDELRFFKPNGLRAYCVGCRRRLY